jgi:hypothetical protein
VKVHKLLHPRTPDRQQPTIRNDTHIYSLENCFEPKIWMAEWTYHHMQSLELQVQLQRSRSAND